MNRYKCATQLDGFGNQEYWDVFADSKNEARELTGYNGYLYVQLIKEDIKGTKNKGVIRKWTDKSMNPWRNYE